MCTAPPGVFGIRVVALPAEIPFADACSDLSSADFRIDFQDGNVERTAPQVAHGDRLFLLLVEAVGEGRRGRLVDDPFDLQSRDFAGVLGGLSLRVVAVRRDGHDRPPYSVP